MLCGFSYILIISGAALESFRSRILSFLTKYEEKEIKNSFLTEIADKVAQDFQILLGRNTIPILLQDISETEDNNNDDDDDLIDPDNNYTGKILVDLSNEECGYLQLEYKDQAGVHLVQVKELENVNLTHDVIPILLKLSIDENVDFVQMFDTSMLPNNAAFDDNTVMECVLEKIGEWQEYENSMAIFDVDSLIGVSENMSDSSMGQSNSYSITNNRLWHQVVVQTANSKLENTKQNAKNSWNSSPMRSETFSSHKWVVVISKNKFICNQFKSLTRFPLTEDELQELEENNKKRLCKNCELLYTNAKNNIDSCSYHDGPLIDNRAKKSEIIHFDKVTLQQKFINSNSTERENTSKNFIFFAVSKHLIVQDVKRTFIQMKL